MVTRTPNEISEELKALVKEVHNPELAKQPGHVYQIWSDGELTLQKSGELLDQRGLHSMHPSMEFKNISWILPEADSFPVKSAGIGFAYVTKEDGKKVGDLIKELVVSRLMRTEY